MKRRSFLAFAAAYAMTPAVRAQGRVYRVAIVGASAHTAPWYAAFEQRLRELGYVDGKNLKYEFRTAEGDVRRYPPIAAEVKQMRADVVVTSGSEFALSALRDALNATPIVAIAIDFDPVARGYVKSLAHPGGNITGIYGQYPELAAKRLEMLCQALPRARRIGALYDASSREQFEAANRVAPRLGVTLLGREFKNTPYDFDAAIDSVAHDGAQAVMLFSSGAFFASAAKIVAAAQRRHLAVVANPNYVDAGVLIGHGPSFPMMLRRAADYADRILKGANPAEIPMEQPTQYELVVNLKTAKALGIAIPQSILLRAYRVIE